MKDLPRFMLFNGLKENQSGIGIALLNDSGCINFRLTLANWFLNVYFRYAEIKAK